MFTHAQKNVTIASMAAINIGIIAYGALAFLPKYKILKNDHDYYKKSSKHWSDISSERFAIIDNMLTEVGKHDPELRDHLIKTTM